MDNYEWTCPFCNRDTTITGNDVAADRADLTINNSVGLRCLAVEFIVCPNPKCKKFVLTVALRKLEVTKGGSLYSGVRVQSWPLIPMSDAQVFPGYVPAPVIGDYNEACSIKTLSPKASATLARRCLQGMIRDFWGIKKARLIDEIDALKAVVDPLTWQAIDAVRKVGNMVLIWRTTSTLLSMSILMKLVD